MSVIKLGDAKKERERQRYNALVLKIYDEMEHEDKRKAIDRKAEVQIQARERL